jgi:hypothetical protein
MDSIVINFEGSQMGLSADCHAPEIGQTRFYPEKFDKGKKRMRPGRKKKKMRLVQDVFGLFQNICCPDGISRPVFQIFFGKISAETWRFPAHACIFAPLLKKGCRSRSSAGRALDF